MKTIRTIKALKKYIKSKKSLKKTIGFVPTMGCLHSGHLSLVEAAKKAANIVIVSIFVNPTQFGPKEDYKKYPRDIKKDAKLLKEMAVDVLFNPTEKEMFEKDKFVYVEVNNLNKKLCGKNRPGHFRGVATIVSKLFNIVEPDAAVFGQKDYQQLLIIKQLTKELNYPIKIISLPIIRESDGLAMSSRNKYLNPLERKNANVLSHALKKARKLIKMGNRNKRNIIKSIQKILTQTNGISIEYIEMLNADDLNDVSMVKGHIIIAVAIKIGKTRLIDNIILRV